MDWYKTASLGKVAQVQGISLQEALDSGMFGPVYHGTSPENRANIDQEGFAIFEGEARQGPISQGYENHPYGYIEGAPPPPVHHLGFGVYFTTSKSIAKNFAGGTARGMQTYYLDVPNLLTINWGIARTMLKWWIENGYDPDLAKKDRVAATKRLTETLASQYDAVWYKGKSMYRLLDGDQICVYDTSKIYVIDKALAQPGDIGSNVKRLQDGMRGTILDIRDATEILRLFEEKAPGQHHPWLNPDTKKILTVKWRKGGTDRNVQDVDVEFI